MDAFSIVFSVFTSLSAPTPPSAGDMTLRLPTTRYLLQWHRLHEWGISSVTGRLSVRGRWRRQAARTSLLCQAVRCELAQCCAPRPQPAQCSAVWRSGAQHLRSRQYLLLMLSS
ncbi:hypothetical protein B5X24_HaOG209674 [Helicoverpa armigera]|uniref:Uncharacterized protein n=1 Tax=Helicoverpa armigera TaxID=29058 RepID=A0A2W1BI22_HELAM|nr:hypothetical protein B5X24_HaOG209674 [Helicoverpa armigera]